MTSYVILDKIIVRVTRVYLINWVIRLFMRRKKVYIGKNVIFDKTIFEGYNKVFKNSKVSNSLLGKYSYVSDRCNISKTKIGKFCSIGPGVTSVLGNHPVNTFVSTHPSFFSNKKQCGISFVPENLFDDWVFVDSEMKYSIDIGNDVWIGTNVLLMQGVIIGNGAVIAAGAVVTKNVEPYSVVGGVPAKLISKRFDSEIVKKIENSQWWDNDEKWFNENIQYMSNIDSFLKQKRI